MGVRWASSGPIRPHRNADSMGLGAWWGPMQPVGEFFRKLTIGPTPMRRMGTEVRLAGGCWHGSPDTSDESEPSQVGRSSGRTIHRSGGRQGVRPSRASKSARRRGDKRHLSPRQAREGARWEKRGAGRRYYTCGWVGRDAGALGDQAGGHPRAESSSRCTALSPPFL